jgi:hypothetical protein
VKRVFGRVYPLFMTASVIKWSEFLETGPEVRVRVPALTNFPSSGSGMESTQPPEYN